MTRKGYYQSSLYSIPKKVEILDSWWSINSNCIYYKVKIIGTNEIVISDEIYGVNI